MIKIVWTFLVAHPKFHPTILISLDLLSSLFYAIAKDYRRAIYWLAAGVLTATVTL